MEWLPIETAPKELKQSGKPVLLWSPSTHTYPLFGRYWSQDMIWLEDAERYPCQPTHWMPLPAPPIDTPT